MHCAVWSKNIIILDSAKISSWRILIQSQQIRNIACIVYTPSRKISSTAIFAFLKIKVVP
jgi:hypothetical protein